jgi:hypothetical protein
MPLNLHRDQLQNGISNTGRTEYSESLRNKLILLLIPVHLSKYYHAHGGNFTYQHTNRRVFDRPGRCGRCLKILMPGQG